MSELRIDLDSGARAYRPGEKIRGRIGWSLEDKETALELHLFWYTTGKGDSDWAVVDTIHIDRPQQSDEQAFEFSAPDQPYSFNGKLISIIWALEVVMEPTERTARVEIEIGPKGQTINPYQEPLPDLL